MDLEDHHPAPAASALETAVLVGGGNFSFGLFYHGDLELVLWGNFEDVLQNCDLKKYI